ncbi:MAG: PA2169 family four-helix-bundle protein [Ilumatobacteraceae bacterium]
MSGGFVVRCASSSRRLRLVAGASRTAGGFVVRCASSSLRSSSLALPVLLAGSSSAALPPAPRDSSLALPRRARGQSSRVPEGFDGVEKGNGAPVHPQTKERVMSTDEAVTKDLLQTLEDGREGYTKGAEKLGQLDQPALVTTFTELAAQRQTFADELQGMANDYGDDPDRSGSVAAALHRGWMSLTDALTKDTPRPSSRPLDRATTMP